MAGAVKKAEISEKSESSSHGFGNAALAAGLIGVGAVALLATHGKGAEWVENLAAKHLPVIEIVAQRAIAVLDHTLEKILPSSTASAIEHGLVDIAHIPSAGSGQSGGLAKLLNGDKEGARKFVFNRLLDRLDGNRYALTGSYSVELSQETARRARDIDLLVFDHNLLRPTRKQTSKAIADDLNSMLSQDHGDGLQFSVNGVRRKMDYLMFPHMRHATVDVTANGAHIMDVPIDMRLTPSTILPLREMKQADAIGAEQYLSSFSAVHKEEVFVGKLHSYVSGLIAPRKPKDLRDMALMVNQGLDSDRVATAMTEYEKSGYQFTKIAHPTNGTRSWVKLYPNWLHEQTPQVLNENFQTVKSFYDDAATSVRFKPFGTPDPSAHSVMGRLAIGIENKIVAFPRSWQGYNTIGEFLRKIG